MNYKFLLPVALLAALSGCGKDKNAVLARGLPGAMAPADHGNTQDTHQANPPAQPAVSSAEQLFASQFKYVDLVCSAYAVDAQALGSDATPGLVFSQQVYPALGSALNQVVQSPSGKLRAQFSVATSLETIATSSGTAPVIVATASAAVQFDGASQGPPSFPSQTLWVSVPAADSTVATVSASDAAASGSLVVRCHLEAGAVSAP